MFFFLSPGILRGPSADRRETFSHDRNLAEFHNASPKIWGALPPKIWGQNIQNFAHFYTAFEFDVEYLRNKSKYPKSES